MASPLYFFNIKRAESLRLAEILSEFNISNGQRWKNVEHNYGRFNGAEEE